MTAIPPQPVCPSCGAEVADTDSFCEACGATLATQQPEPAATQSGETQPGELQSGELQSGQDQSGPAQPTTTPRPCQSCGGEVGSDGYCLTCGTLAAKERDHYTEQPADWVAGVCDRGIRHHRNEDASALFAEPEPGSRAVLVVCDGVSTSTDSDVASLAAARRARDVLASHRPVGMGVPGSREAALAAACEEAAAEANQAVIDNSEAAAENTASCTFVAAVIEGDLVVHANIGDSRAYWIPDPGGAEEPIQLTVDDSVAQVRMAAGVSRVEAENGPQAHAIIKWLGRDSSDFVPSTGSITVQDDGWLLVCSDGLWNYASEAADLQELIHTSAKAGHVTPLALADALVAWACEQGGRDNITVTLARHGQPADTAY